MDLHNNFYNDEEKTLATLPDKLRETAIEKFMSYIVYELQKLLLHSEDDETLHSTRKFLEDIAYNWVNVQPYTSSLSGGLRREEEIISFIEILGIFNDKCIHVTLLQTYCDDATEHDKMVLQKIMHTWKIQKQELKQIIYDWLDLIKAGTGKKANALTSIDTGHS
jgi:hypothetical protein